MVQTSEGDPSGLRTNQSGSRVSHAARPLLMSMRTRARMPAPRAAASISPRQSPVMCGLRSWLDSAVGYQAENPPPMATMAVALA